MGVYNSFKRPTQATSILRPAPASTTRPGPRSSLLHPNAADEDDVTRNPKISAQHTRIHTASAPCSSLRTTRRDLD